MLRYNLVQKYRTCENNTFFICWAYFPHVIEFIPILRPDTKPMVVYPLVPYL